MAESEPRAITDDIHKVAKDIAEGGLSPLRLYLAIAQALLAERERCAKVAEETGKAYCRDHFVMMGPAGIAHKIAHAIRQDNPNET